MKDRKKKSCSSYSKKVREGDLLKQKIKTRKRKTWNRLFGKT